MWKEIEKTKKVLNKCMKGLAKRELRVENTHVTVKMIQHTDEHIHVLVYVKQKTFC